MGKLKNMDLKHKYYTKLKIEKFKMKKKNDGLNSKTSNKLLHHNIN